MARSAASNTPTSRKTSSKTAAIENGSSSKPSSSDPPLLPPNTPSNPRNPRYWTPILPPNTLLKSPASQALRWLHPLILGAGFYLRFPYLVQDPVAELLQASLWLHVLQFAFVVTCVPASTEWFGKEGEELLIGSKSETRGKKKSSTKKRSTGDEVPLYHRLTLATLSLILTDLIAAPAIFIIMVLFGAPITTHLPQTSLCALHATLLSAFPLFYIHGLSRSAWMETVTWWIPFDEIWGGAAGVFVGGWLGAIPIPLDWDRDWQRWPITIVCGVYGGYFVGRLFGGTLLYGKRIELEISSEDDEEKEEKKVA